MSWLSEAMKDFEPPHCNVGARKSGKRMARVIRELAGEVIYRRALLSRAEEGMTGFREVYCTTVVPDKPKLSSDTKELLK